MKPYYEHAGITIYHGDCREVMEEWEGLRMKSFDLLLTDPPYGLGIAANPVRQAHERESWDDLPADFETLATAIRMCSKAVIWGGNYFSLPPHQCFLAWDKKQPEDFSLAMAEMAWTNLGGPAKLFRQSVTSYGKDHPTQKPLELIEWCIRLASGAKILDPFMGSGTTLVAAKRLGRKAVGIELHEKYCEIAAKRLSQDVLPLVQSEPVNTQTGLW